jgi:hypothetical protein
MPPAGQAGQDAGQRDRQHEQQRDRFLAAELTPCKCECGERAENYCQQRRDCGYGE